jgi:hypothetical protein
MAGGKDPASYKCKITMANRFRSALVILAMTMAGCGAGANAPPRTPAPTAAAQASLPACSSTSYCLHLDMSGAMVGTITEVGPDVPPERNFCGTTQVSGKQLWVVKLYATAQGKRMGVWLAIVDFKGPGTYSDVVQVFTEPRFSMESLELWGKSTITVGQDQRSGTVGGLLDNVITYTAPKLHISGSFGCARLEPYMA